MTRRVNIAEADLDVTLPTWSCNDSRRLEGAAASEERQTVEFARAVPTEWRAVG
jgi:hypothetical protein